MKKYLILGLTAVVIFIFVGVFCWSWVYRPEKAFYYWKTTWDSSPELESVLTDNQIQKLYVRFFDLSWNRVFSVVEITAPIRKKTDWTKSVKVIPVIYIENAVLKNISDASLNDWVYRLFKEINRIDPKLPFDELQIDCDWSMATREKYFTLLKKIKLQLNSQQIISATIRLHQIKYPKIVGVPPIDRGMLMFYNMGKIEKQQVRNSIYNSTDTLKYIKALRNYPLDLDLALPLFSWFVQYRESRPIKLIENLSEDELLQGHYIQKIAENKYRVVQSHFLRGRFLREDDELVVEKVNQSLALEAADLAKKYIKLQKRTIALFDLNNFHRDNLNKKFLRELYAFF